MVFGSSISHYNGSFHSRWGDSLDVSLILMTGNSLLWPSWVSPYKIRHGHSRLNFNVSPNICCLGLDQDMCHKISWPTPSFKPTVAYACRMGSQIWQKCHLGLLSGYEMQLHSPKRWYCIEMQSILMPLRRQIALIQTAWELEERSTKLTSWNCQGNIKSHITILQWNLQ